MSKEVQPEEVKPEEPMAGHIYPWMRGKDAFVALDARQVPPGLRKVLAKHKKGAK